MENKTYEYKTVTARFGTAKHDKQLNEAAKEGYVLIAEVGGGWHTIANLRRERGKMPTDFVYEYKSVVSRINRMKQHDKEINKATAAGFVVDANADKVNGRARYTRLRRKVFVKNTGKEQKLSFVERVNRKAEAIKARSEARATTSPASDNPLVRANESAEKLIQKVFPRYRWKRRK
jgi:hypothetical protein